MSVLRRRARTKRTRCPRSVTEPHRAASNPADPLPVLPHGLEGSEITAVEDFPGGSPELAAKFGATVVTLPEDGLLTAARGRNAGYAELKKRFPDCEAVQYVQSTPCTRSIIYTRG